MRCKHIAYIHDHKKDSDRSGHFDLLFDALSCDDFVANHFLKRARIPDTESLGLSYGSFMTPGIGLVVPPFVVAIRTIKV
jgi:hypothetical protein